MDIAKSDKTTPDITYCCTHGADTAACVTKHDI